MEQPEVGSRWAWEYMNDSVTIEVEESKSDEIVFVSVVDNSFLEKEVRLAEHTYEKNGEDEDNVEEVVPFAKYKNGKFQPAPSHIFTSLSQFYEECERIE